MGSLASSLKQPPTLTTKIAMS